MEKPSSAVPFVRYSEPFPQWIREGLHKIDQMIRKAMKMHKTLYKRDDIHKLYALRKVGGRRLVSIEDNVDASIRRHENYIKNSVEN